MMNQATLAPGLQSEPALPGDILTFLGGRTSLSWCQVAVRHLDDLLVDHAQCEKKAASSALQLMFRYPQDELLAYRMSRLAREELRHFEQVLKLMQERGVPDRKQVASRYAAGLRECIAPQEPLRLVDTLIVGAFIEARSCERFARLVPYLPQNLAKFYAGLLESEGRHYQHYLEMAEQNFDRMKKGHRLESFQERVERIRQVEWQLIDSPDQQFRFHSGVPGGELLEQERC